MKSIILAITLIFSCVSNATTLIVGDSLAYIYGEACKASPKTVDYWVGAGLNQPRQYKWFSSYLNKKYDNYIISLGTNDMMYPERIEKYQKLVHDIVPKEGNVWWILPPQLKSPQKSKLLDNTRKAILLGLEGTNTKIIDAKEILGGYSQSINGVKVRTSDGIHITLPGAEMVVKDIPICN